MKKKLLSIALALVTTCSFAQLSERENDASMIKLGARPQAGDMSLTFGYDAGGVLDSNDADAQLFTGNFFAKGDFLTFKWYKSDDMVVRVGIRLSKHTNKLSGDILDSSAVAGNQAIYGGSMEAKTMSREYVLVPGIEKHFSSSNVFDVYAGGDLYLGFGKEDSVVNRTYGKGNAFGYDNGDKEDWQATTGNTIVGIGGVVGFNVFIAQLPISIGLEYGLNMKWTMGGKTQWTHSQTVQGTTIEGAQTWQEAADGSSSLKFKDGMKKSRFDMDTNQDVRAVLNIYFKQ
jgi:hypothetical protein